MKRGLFSLALLAMSLVGSTGCVGLHRGHGFGQHNACNTCNGPIGCRPCRLGWQRGGTDYGAHLSHAGAHRFDGTHKGHLLHGGGLHGGGLLAGLHGAGSGGLSHAQYRADDQVGSGVPGPTVAYPYYTTRGPRDFLLDNPPSIGR
jgi:hypothetical protein